MLKVLIVIPCFNEEDSIASTVEEVREKLASNSDVIFEPIVINDASTDRSLSVVQNIGVNHIDLPVNLGIGGAVQSGYLYAQANDFDIAVQLDGDGQHNPSYIKELIQPIISDDADVVIGSRFISKKGFQSTRLRRFGIKYFSWLNDVMVNVKILDTTSGFRAINRNVINTVCEYYPEKYPEPESIILYSFHSYRITEIPVEMRGRSGGKSSITGFKSLFYMFKVTVGILFLYIRLKSKR